MEFLEKTKIRNIHIKKRKEMTFFEKEEKDKKIFEKLINLEQILNTNIILTYVSVALEVDTINFIKHCFKFKKRVAVPVSLHKEKEMKFYFINSLKELHYSSFSLLEPSEKNENLCNSFSDCIFIVPGFVFDFNGNRIGYGGGFYDRFLSKINCFKIGICYDFNLEKKVENTPLDVPVDIIITENRILKI